MHITTPEPLRLVTDLLMQWSASTNPAFTEDLEQTCRAFFESRSAGDRLATTRKHSKRKKPTNIVLPSDKDVSFKRTKRLQNRGAAPKQRLTNNKRVVYTPVSTPVLMLEEFSFDNLRKRELLPSNFRKAYFGGGCDDDVDAAEWLHDYATDVTGYVGLHIQHAEVYYEHEHARATKPAAVYGVDIITLATADWVFSWHASQCQEEDAWFPPGPYIAASGTKNRKQRHYDNKKWHLLPALEELMSRRDITLVGMHMRAMITRLKRTFWLSTDKTWKPNTKDLGTILRASKSGRASKSLRAAVKSHFMKEMVGKDDSAVSASTGCFGGCWYGFLWGVRARCVFGSANMGPFVYFTARRFAGSTGEQTKPCTRISARTVNSTPLQRTCWPLSRQNRHSLLVPTSPLPVVPTSPLPVVQP